MEVVMKKKDKEEYKAYIDKMLIEWAIKDEQKKMRKWIGEDWRAKIQEFIKSKAGQKWLKNYKKLKKDCKIYISAAKQDAQVWKCPICGWKGI